MRIRELAAEPNFRLIVTAEDGRKGSFDVGQYLTLEAFEKLREPGEFEQVSNGGYFIEWKCGADLSADTIEARWRLIK